MAFIRNKENFVCEQCGKEVTGNGYTNHCPQCLWSKHVDIHPGDRAHECGGMMKPIGVAFEKGEWVIHHECVRCHAKKNNKSVPSDNFKTIIDISSPPITGQVKKR